jgi:mono/diheme cytochrome c family protein
MRRALIATGLLVVVLGALAAGCGGQGTVAPLPNTVEGTLPTATTAATPAAKGNPAAGKAVFASAGCGGCHTYKPASATGKVGPDLDKLASDAKKANQGTLDHYTLTSIKDPNAYIVPGFTQGVMPDTYGTSLSSKQLADLVAFLTQTS